MLLTELLIQSQKLQATQLTSLYPCTPELPSFLFDFMKNEPLTTLRLMEVNGGCRYENTLILWILGWATSLLGVCTRFSLGSVQITGTSKYFIRCCGDVCCTCSDDRADVSSTQTGSADSRPRDVRPVNHLVHTVISHSDHHPVLRDNTGRDRQSHSSGDTFKESFVWSGKTSETRWARRRRLFVFSCSTSTLLNDWRLLGFTAEKKRILMLKSAKGQSEDCLRATRNAQKWFNYIHDEHWHCVRSYMSIHVRTKCLHQTL